jgi:hypothetical protein
VRSIARKLSASTLPRNAAPIRLHRRTSFRPSAVAARLCFLAAFFCTLAAASAGAAHAQTSEYDVKAAYLFNFGKFIRVAGAPQPQNSTFDICILGRDPIGRAMDDIAANESIDDRPVRVSRISDASQGRKCAILFISPYEGDAIREDLAVLGDADALTVSDAPDFLEHGGMIQFVPDDDHVRFAVNLDAVGRTHLVLSSELLRVAATVKGKPQGVQR